MNEAKEKAKELVEKFRKAIKSKVVCDNNPKFGAKQCALICVDEIIEANPYEYNDKHYLNPYHSDQYEPNTIFWQQVKTEIEKL